MEITIDIGPTDYNIIHICRSDHNNIDRIDTLEFDVKGSY